ncbi:MAG TPA: hypothetical protein VKP65_20555, partial [Rhodothermales bacterium]|nr:hypothetical protein [Rhodothermales bacterium]
QCLFKDPEGKERPFPEGCPVTLEFPTALSEQKKLGPDGLLDCFVLREKAAFTLRFQFGGVTYLASPPPDVLAPDKLVAEADVETLHAKGHRLFKLPQDFRLADADWQVSGTPTYNATTHHFEQLENLSITNIGSAATPAKVLLDPHWLYTRLEFFDRVYGHDHHDHERIPLPPLMLEGFHDASAVGNTPDEQCNWIANPGDLAKAAQCVPWILQKAGPKPDNKVLVQFRTKKNTYIVSDDPTTRRLDVITDAEKLKPGPDRLKYYDLPEVWRTQHYHARSTSGDGAAFEKLTAAQIKAAMQPDKPLVFSLDDMVLTDQSLQPLAWLPKDRAAIFSHKFGKDGKSKLAKHGLYKPDTGNDQSFLTEEQTVEKTRNYVVDYPNWTRLIVAQGNLWGAFDQRLPDKPGLPVGARAAVRWVDSAGLKAPGNEFSPRPGLSSSSTPVQDAFFVVQPFFEQQHDYHGGIGRFDLALLRCCDVKDDTEMAINLHYFRLFFNFTFTPTKEEKKAGRQAAGLTGAKARKFEDKTSQRIINIWNGNHSKNRHAAFLLPQDAVRKLKIKVCWYLQAIPQADKALAHFEVRVFKDIRASMGSFKGTGQLSTSHTSANPHEAGHADSLGDEYIERWRSASYYQPGFYSFSPGSPFDFDKIAMMRGNKEIRARYFWYVAEWLHKCYQFPFQVQHNTYTFKLPTHTDKPTRTHVSFPTKQAEDTEVGERGNFDLYLYRLGDDEYNDIVLRTKASGGKIGGDPFDALLIVLVKMRFEFHTDDHNTIKDGV